MLKEQFLGRYPSHFHVNPIVKAYIISESFLWSAWNFITPIFSVFVVTSIPEGNLQYAALGFSVYLISRVVFELLSGRLLTNTKDSQKIIASIFGILIIGVSYGGFAMTDSIIEMLVFYGFSGMGLGIASPAKNSLFATHLDKNKEATEWGIADAFAFVCMALAASLGGFIATAYGFQVLFWIAFGMNILSVFPYLLFLSKR